MKLTFRTEYEDYGDRERLGAYIEDLRSWTESVPEPAALPDGVLLDYMEALDDLIRYDVSLRNYGRLEGLMRRQQSLLELCRRRGIEGEGYLFLDMEFARMNAMLYRANGQNRQAAEEYGGFRRSARACLERLKAGTDLTEEQALFVGWSCVEGLREATDTDDADTAAVNDPNILYELLDALNYVTPHLGDAAGIQDQVADTYGRLGAALMNIGDRQTGGQCFAQAVDLLQQLARIEDGGFYAARAVWVRGLWGFQTYVGEGDATEMLACETEAERLLAEREFEDRDRGILLGTRGVILLQRSAAIQQSGDLSGALSVTQEAVGQLREGLRLLEEDFKSRPESTYRTIVGAIAAQLFTSLISALDMLGGQYYASDRYKEAQDAFDECLGLLHNTGEYRVGAAAALVLQAECCQYLALIAPATGRETQAEFYASQAVRCATEAAQQTGNPAAWGLVVSSSAVLSELYLNQRDKARAGEYARQGLEACDTLARIMPDAPQLGMRGALEKLLKKASRRFF